LETLHGVEIERLKKYVSEGKNVFVCGATGTGKSFVVNSVLDASNSVEFQSDMINKTNLSGNSNTYIIIDGFESSVKQLIDDNTRRLVIISTEVYMLPNFELIIMPQRSPELIATLAPDSLDAAKKCRGNIRNFFDYLNYSDDKDIFKTSKDIISDILCTPGNFNLSQNIHEHGHICDVFHSNYLNSNTIHPEIIDSLSIADKYDTLMYKGDWDFMHYYIVSGIAIPKLYMDSVLKPEDIKPGSAWTKYGNFKMRQQKLKNIQKRQCHSNIGVEELSVIRMYAANGNYDNIVSYNLNSSDFDVMNHLALGNKMKQSEVMRVKKKIRNIYNEF